MITDSATESEKSQATLPDCCVLIASYNRKEKTLACLESLYKQEPPVRFDVLLVDDASSDGTAEAVSATYPLVKILKGNGDLYWAGGMRLAFETALSTRYPNYLWLNDDVLLEPDALNRLLSASDEMGGKAIVGGSMLASSNGRIAYGGSVIRSRGPFRYKLIEARPVELVRVDVLHGNLLLAPDSVAREIGGIAPYLKHLGGDFEYCLRARSVGIESVLAPGHFGICEPNPPSELKRGIAGLRRMLSVKQLPIECSLPLYRNYGGVAWPFWLALPYLRAFLVGCR